MEIDFDKRQFRRRESKMLMRLILVCDGWDEFRKMLDRLRDAEVDHEWDPKNFTIKLGVKREA